MMSEGIAAGAPQTERTSLTYVQPSFSKLDEWIVTHCSTDRISNFCQSYSRSFLHYLIERKMLSQENLQKLDKYDRTTVFINIDLQVLDTASKQGLCSSFLSKIEERKKVFADIEALEYGISSDTANDRINLLIQVLKDLSSLCNENQIAPTSDHLNDSCHDKISVKDTLTDHFTILRASSFLELCWWVTISILHEIKYPVTKMLQAEGPVLSSAHLLLDILTECNIKARLSVEKFQHLRGTTEDFNGKNVPMIVFSNADINSALDAAVNAAWFTEGLVPWATSCILVQEGIHLKFISALKKRLQQSAATIAITHTNLNNEDELKENSEEILSKARKNHLEIFQVAPATGKHQPATLIIGDFVSVPLSLIPRTTNKTQPILFIVPFRKIQEGIAIANCSSEKIAASVWSESFSQCLSATTQLDFGTIWVNSHGIFDSIVPFFSGGSGCEPCRPTGFDYYHWNKDLADVALIFPSANLELPDAEIQNYLALAYREYLNWAGKDFHNYVEILNKIWKQMDSKLVPSNLREQLVESLRVINSATVQVKNCVVSTIVRPVGVIIFALESESKQMPILLLKLVLQAVFSRNAVIVVGKKIDLSFLTSALPKGVLNIMTENFPSDNLCHIVSTHKHRANMSVWTLGEDYVRLHTRSGDQLKYYQFLPNVDIRSHVTRKKVIWMPFG